MEFISTAFAQTSSAPASDQWQMLIPMVAMVAIIFFLVIRPQQKKAKETQAMLSKIRRGDSVVTSGGIVGKVTKATDGPEIEVEIASDVRVRIMRQMIVEVRSKSAPVKDATSDASSS